MKTKTAQHKYDRILLVDDMELDNFVNKKLMTIHHFAKKIYVCTSGKGAFEFLENLVSTNVHLENYPQVIFVDINMPLMNGYQFIELMNKQFQNLNMPQPRLVVLTSSVFQSDRQQAMALSDDISFMIKPLTKEMLETL